MHGGTAGSGEGGGTRAGAAQRSEATPDLDARNLFGPGRRVVLIRHEGETYQLRLTSNNKLILTK